MPYDPNDPCGPNSPLWRQMEEIRRIKQIQDIVDQPMLRAMRGAERMQTALGSGHDVVGDFKRQFASLLGPTVSESLREAARVHQAAVVPSLVFNYAVGMGALGAVTQQLALSGLLAGASQDILRGAGVIEGTNTILRNLPRFDPPLSASIRLDPTLVSVASVMNDRLRTSGLDALTAAALSTGSIAANVAQMTQGNDQLRTILQRQWETFGGLSAAVGRLYTVPGMESRLTALPGYLAFAPVIEPYAIARSLLLFTPSGVTIEEPLVLDVLAEEVLDDLSAELESRLAEVNPDLVESVLGAWDTARSSSRDRVRQVSSSIRFAIEGVIEEIAPKDDADAWAQAQGFGRKGVVPDGARDARSGRKWAPQIRYVFRVADQAVGDESLLSEIADADLADMLLLLERLNQAVHRGEGEIGEQDLTMMLRRATAFITLLLDAHQASRA